jgi:hypothetical protein
VSIAPAAASDIPQFDVSSHVAALAADPPKWPARTTAVSLLALDVDVPRHGLLAPLGPQQRRLEFLDYPGEWLLDLPLLGQSFSRWSKATLRRQETLNNAEVARTFLGFVRGLLAGAVADEALTLTGHRPYVDVLHRLPDEAGLAFLQPGRFLLALPGAPPSWTQFFPLPGRGPLANLMEARFKAYVDSVRRDLMSPMFGNLAKPTGFRRPTSPTARCMRGSTQASRYSERRRYLIASTFGTSQDSVEAALMSSARRAATNGGGFKLLGRVRPVPAWRGEPDSQGLTRSASKTRRLLFPSHGPQTRGLAHVAPHSVHE